MHLQTHWLDLQIKTVVIVLAMQPLGYTGLYKITSECVMMNCIRAILACKSNDEMWHKKWPKCSAPNLCKSKEVSICVYINWKDIKKKINHSNCHAILGQFSSDIRRGTINLEQTFWQWQSTDTILHSRPNCLWYS